MAAEISRCLASLRTIDLIELHPLGDDQLTTARIGGWRVAIEKTADLVEGDMVIFFEIDSFIPASVLPVAVTPPSLVLYKGKQGHHVKTSETGGILTQGMILGVEDLDEIFDLVAGIIAKFEAETAAGRSDEMIASDIKDGIFNINLPSVDDSLGAEPGKGMSKGGQDVSDLTSLSSIEEDTAAQDCHLSPEQHKRIRALLEGLDLTALLKVEQWQPDSDVNVAVLEAPMIHDQRESLTAAGLATPINPTLGKPPKFVPNCNISRVQNCPNLFKSAKYRTQRFQESIKLDGAAMTVYFVPSSCPALLSALGPPPPVPSSHRDALRLTHPSTTDRAARFGICTKRHHVSELCSLVPANQPCNDRLYRLMWRVAERLDIPFKLARSGLPIAIQGELIGPGIAGGRMNHHLLHLLPLPPVASECTGVESRQEDPRCHDFFVHTVVEYPAAAASSGRVPANVRPLPPAMTVRRAAELGLSHVPVRGYVLLHEIDGELQHDGLLKRADEVRTRVKVPMVGGAGRGKQSGGGKEKEAEEHEFEEEGLVFKNTVDVGRGFKVISNRWLLRYGE